MVNCCVPFCKSYHKNKNISFHEFPVDSQLSQKWLTVIARKDFVINDKSSSSRVCSIHFRPEDYVSGLKLKRLKKGTIPSVFPGYPPHRVPKQIKERKMKRFEGHPKKHGTKRKCRDETNASITTNAEENSDTENQGRHSVVRIEDAELLSHFASKVENAKNESSKIQYNSGVLSNLEREVQQLKSLLQKKNHKIREQDKKIEEIQNKLRYYEEDEYHMAVTKLICYEEYENSISRFLLQQLKKFGQKNPHG